MKDEFLAFGGIAGKGIACSAVILVLAIIFEKVIGGVIDTFEGKNVVRKTFGCMVVDDIEYDFDAGFVQPCTIVLNSRIAVGPAPVPAYRFIGQKKCCVEYPQ